MGLWRRYWEVHFRDERMTCVQIWEQSIREKSLALSRQDAREYVKKLPGKSELPDQIPQGYAAHDMLVAPSYFGPPHLMFYGYGSVIVIYDFLITQEHRDQNVSLANFPVWIQGGGPSAAPNPTHPGCSSGHRRIELPRSEPPLGR